MKKRGVTLLVLSLLLPLVFAVHTATVSTNYVSVYETNQINITLDVENDVTSSSTINQVEVQQSGFNINNIILLVDWAMTNNNSIIFSTSTAGISNWGSQKFGFEMIADNVAQDTTNDWAITTTDANSDSQINDLQLTVLNDNTAPVITATTPGQFIPGANELFSVTANDPETAISAANLHISNCDLVYDNVTNTSSMIYSDAALACVNDVCSASQDLTSWNEGDVCFNYDISNKGGETALSGDLTTIIDRTPPVIDLTSPDDSTFITAANVDLQFNAVDNYDTQLDCNVNVNSNPNPITTNSVNNSYALTVADGVYSWNVDCTDEVALVGTSLTKTFTVDNQAPTITINAPALTDRGNDVVITFDAIDAGSGVDINSITAEIIDTNGNATPIAINGNQITYSTTTATIPGDYTVRITANDNLAHTAVQTAQFRIRETYAISIALNQTQIDASNSNTTYYVTLTGNVKKDDGSIPASVDLIEIITNESLTPDVITGDFSTQIEIPQIESQFTIYAQYLNGVDTFTATATINVGPYCGNGVVDNNEQCDGSTAAVCSDYGFSQGTVSCTASCTIDNSQCSNPPAQQSSGSSGNSGGSRHSSSSGVFYMPPQPSIEEPIVETKTSGIIEPLQEQPQLIVNEEPAEVSPQVAEEQPVSSGIGIGTSWAVFTDYAKEINKNLLLAIIAIGILLYVFGFRKNEDDWDRYFKKYGHH